MTKLRKMTCAELEHYFPFLQDTFPKTELKPLYRLLELYERGIYDMWLVESDGEDKGIALLLRSHDCQYILLDYLAMFQKGGGFGSQCLELLKTQYPNGILVEAEAILPELDEETKLLRTRRQNFYQRAGFVPCPFENEVFGVVYTVHLWAETIPEDRSKVCARELFLNYKEQCKEKWLKTRVFIQGFNEK